MNSTHEWREATVVDVNVIADNIRQIEFAVAGSLPAFEPGSHITIRAEADGAAFERSYSCLPSVSGRVRVAVKLSPTSRGGSRFMWSLETGDYVKLTVPENRFALSWRAPSYLMVAGGIGITPIYGMALALAARGADVRLVYAAKTCRQLAFAEELKAALGDKVAFYIGEIGDRMNLVSEIARLHEDGETYVCGPLRLLAEAQARWAESGRPTSRLRYEVFGGLGDQPGLPFSVQVVDRDVVIDVASGESMLDALTAAGVDMVWECRRGECGLCAVDLVDIDGEIDHRDVYLSAEEKRRNTRMCPCVSRVTRGQATIDTGYRPF